MSLTNGFVSSELQLIDLLLQLIGLARRL